MPSIFRVEFHYLSQPRRPRHDVLYRSVNIFSVTRYKLNIANWRLFVIIIKHEIIEIFESFWDNDSKMSNVSLIHCSKIMHLADLCRKQSLISEPASEFLTQMFCHFVQSMHTNSEKLQQRHDLRLTFSCRNFLRLPRWSLRSDHLVILL